MLEQPSALLVLPSSHCSPDSTTPLPQQGTIGVWSQVSVDSLHASDVHTFVSAQLRGGPGKQVPFWQVSVVVQKAPSLQAEPLGRSR